MYVYFRKINFPDKDGDIDLMKMNSTLPVKGPNNFTKAGGVRKNYCLQP